METAKFRFTNERSVGLEFDANITTVEAFSLDLSSALLKYSTMYPNALAALHMLHEKRWMPLNWDGSAKTIYAKTDSPALWSERMAQEIINLWQDTVNHSDRINGLVRRSIKAMEENKLDG